MTIAISAALKAHLAGSMTTTTTCWLVVLTNGTVRGFTAFDADLVFNLEAAMVARGLAPTPGILGTGSVTYQAAFGYTPSDTQGGDDLSLDTMEVDGVLNFPSLDEADLNAGLWDFAAVTVFLVNWKDLTMGAMILRSGTLGQVTVERGTFKAEILGPTNAYSRNVGELTSASCRADLGDARCKVDLTPFTVTSSLTGVGADNQTMYDSALTQPGPTGAVVVTAITKSNPGHVTTASPLGVGNGSPITFYGCLGMTQINTDTVCVNPSGNNFDVDVDTTSFGTYTASSGSVVALGGTSGYFDYGVITFTGGLNAGLSMEVKSYVPGQFTLQLPMPYACAIGDTYTMHAGCGKSLINDCQARFNNVVNFRGEPYLPGIDRLVQVGKQPPASK